MNNSLNGKFRGPHLHRGTQSIDETRNKESEIKARHHSPKAVVPRILYTGHWWRSILQEKSACNSKT